MDGFSRLEERLRARCQTLALRRGEPMSRHSLFRIGGPVRLMALPQSQEELQICLQEAAPCALPLFILGRGSNLLVSDEPMDIFVIQIAGGLHKLTQTGKRSLYAEAGASLLQLADFAAKRGLGGLEFAQGIPGSVGGGVRMNAGAYGGEMAQVVSHVDALSREGTPRRFSHAELDFSYRHSRFAAEDWVITGAGFSLQQGEETAIRRTMAELMARRREKQPLEYPSGGSTFKRPPGQFAGALIEQCGLKGRRIGDAQVSEKHAGFVINRGGATCREVRELILLVQETVRQETGIQLEPELCTLGFSFSDEGKRSDGDYGAFLSGD